jgi:hypothetical protein
MTLNELLPAVQALPRGDKLHLIEALAADMARDEAIVQGDAPTAYPVWSPYEAFEGAATLLSVLEQDRGTS